MRHLGDITKISGYEVLPVDCVIGGSPCQDLSVAGKRAGLAGERSGLFMEQIRIVKEIRENDRKSGRTGNLVRPRFLVWENVPGALSSNKGEDFRAVLEEICRIADKSAVVPRPEKWRAIGCIMGNGYSVAWRILDAQFWGVPQRRRRIALVADFGGHAAPEILFERKGVCGDTPAGGETGQGTAAKAETGAGTADNCLTPWDVQSRRIYTEVGLWPALYAGEGGGHGYIVRHLDGTYNAGNPEIAKRLRAKANLNFREDSDTLVLSFSGGQGAKAGGLGIAEECAPSPKAADSGSNRVPCVCIPINDKATRCNGGGETRTGDGAGNGLGVGRDGDPAPTLTAGDRHGVAVFDTRGNGTGSIVPTLTGDHQRAISDYTAVEVLPFDTTQITSPQNGSNPHYGDPCHPLAAGAHAPSIVIGRRNHRTSDVSGTMQANETSGQDLDYINHVMQGCAVRRLTPLECERLQGYPDGWTLLEPIEDMPDGAYIFWREVLFEKAKREEKARLNTQGVWEVWRYVTPEHKCFDSTHTVDQDGGYWENTHKPYRHKTQRQMVRWYNKSFCEDTDSARYKALGNSIALPPWKWVLKRISALYERDATMASLFDGIGGFPLIWEQLNGRGSCLWASEIEEFPIAVTRRRFGDG
ncbi:DNA cytosine methyltransferase [Intestinibacillus massiliensis]|uniref:DNA cytosine methyltransferase n=1 Tax=Intestinibacillus massiliensis TaxID=1871029 RepID=UPI002E260031|nr:DNA cytosine methyltransferase [Intestinibacillus massiliensis]